MKDTRKNIKVVPMVKAQIESLRNELGLKTESHVLAYLVAMYSDQKHKKISLGDHQEYLKDAEEANRQTSL